MDPPREDLIELTASEAMALIRERRLSSLELVDALLAWIERVEPGLRAWETLEPERAREHARAADDTRGAADDRPLQGLPLGVKDIIDTRGMRTAAGFPVFDCRVPDSDAMVVTQLQRAGAFVLGKTVTTQFAHADPPRTLNPWAADRTPGGSSTGSAVAVAAREVPVALGTQTGGSVVRPAYYNGVVGFKPTRERLSRRGVFPLSWSLDHIGFLARSVADCSLLLAAIPGPAPRPPISTTPRFGLLVEALSAADSPVADHTMWLVEEIRARGAVVEEVGLGWTLEQMNAVHYVVMQSEAAALHADLFAVHAPAYGPRLRSYLEVGAAIPAAAYLHARRLQKVIAKHSAKVAAGYGALLLPPSLAQSPDVSTTGDSSLQAPFSLAGLPSITLPTGVSAEGLPHGVQMVGGLGRDHDLLAVARWCEQQLPPMPAPPALQSGSRPG